MQPTMNAVTSPTHGIPRRSTRSKASGT
jgi:hypothetical protein